MPLRKCLEPLLMFTMELVRNPTLRSGRLFLIDKKTHLIANRYIATSGLPGYQDYGNMETKARGVIPDSSYVDPSSYTVATTPINLPNTRGVEGNFYAITPYEIKLAVGTRGDFGVHRDANVPGTAGCIGLMTSIGWTEFQDDLLGFSTRGIKSLPLVIAYTRQI